MINRGERWTPHEDEQLRKEYYEEKLSVYNIAEIHGRSVTAINMRLGIEPQFKDRPRLLQANTSLQQTSDNPGYFSNVVESTQPKDRIIIVYDVVWLYILGLSSGKFYVGTTKNLSRRFNEHWSGTGSEWTKKYPPLEVTKVLRNKTPLDEDYEVKKLMLLYGIDNVRGGSYSSIILHEDQLKTLNRELNHSKGGCFGCGSQTHWVKDCSVKNTELPVNYTDKLKLVSQQENHQPDVNILSVKCTLCGSKDHDENRLDTDIVTVVKNGLDTNNCCIQ